MSPTTSAPYGAEDPSTESVRADHLLEDAGYREAGVVVLVEDVDVTTVQGRDRVAAIADQLGADPEVATVSSYLDTGSRDFVSRSTATPPTWPRL